MAASEAQQASEQESEEGSTLDASEEAEDTTWSQQQQQQPGLPGRYAELCAAAHTAATQGSEPLQPRLVVLCGPRGAGKSVLLERVFGIPTVRARGEKHGGAGTFEWLRAAVT